jgi:hypothetical protein
LAPVYACTKIILAFIDGDNHILCPITFRNQHEIVKTSIQSIRIGLSDAIIHDQEITHIGQASSIISDSPMGAHPTIPILSSSRMISLYDSDPTCDPGIRHFSDRE